MGLQMPYTLIIYKEHEELARKIEEEKKKLATLKQQDEVDNIIVETDLETKEKVIINIHSRWDILL